MLRFWQSITNLIQCDSNQCIYANQKLHHAKIYDAIIMQNGYNVDATDSQIKRADNYTNINTFVQYIRIPIFYAGQILIFITTNALLTMLYSKQTQHLHTVLNHAIRSKQFVVFSFHTF